jgi:hypothetical protein
MTPCTTLTNQTNGFETESLGPKHFAGDLLGCAYRYDPNTRVAILTSNDSDYYVVTVGETQLYGDGCYARLSMSGAAACSRRYSRDRANAIYRQLVRKTLELLS